MIWLLAVLSLALSSAAPQEGQPPLQILQEIRIDGATVFTREDVRWLLDLREQAPLPKPAAAVAAVLQQAYERDGYSEAKVSAVFAEGRLLLTVDEGRIDDIEILGVTAANAERFRQRLGLKPGDIYNSRVIGRAAARLTAEAQGGIAIGEPRRDQPGARRTEAAPDHVSLERRGGRNVLVVPVRWRRARMNANVGSGREDLFSPADGLSPAVRYTATIFDHARFNHTYVDGYVSYKFGRNDPGYSFGAERPLFGGTKLFLGAEVHDITTSDDLWRITRAEQAFAALAFKNTFRDYYRRRGAQVFTVLRLGAGSELSAIARRDRHEPLPNATNYSFFRDGAAFRENMTVRDRHVNALVLGYTLDTRTLSGPGQTATYERHLKDSLFGHAARPRPGFRMEWTSEIAGHGLGGDDDFDRHILNARAYVATSSRTLLSVRGLFGWSTGPLPVERQFAIGGIGSVHGYAFKEASGSGMALLNAEYRVDLSSILRGNRDGPNVVVFYDAGRVTPAAGRPWLRGVGVGVGAGGFRVEFGFRANDIPRSRQVLVRFSPTF